MSQLTEKEIETNMRFILACMSRANKHAALMKKYTGMAADVSDRLKAAIEPSKKPTLQVIDGGKEEKE